MDLDAAIRARLAADDARESDEIYWDAYRDAIPAVLDLHKPRIAVEGPFEGEPICDACSNGTDEHLATPNPCPTKREIAKALGIEVDRA